MSFRPGKSFTVTDALYPRNADRVTIGPCILTDFTIKNGSVVENTFGPLNVTVPSQGSVTASLGTINLTAGSWLVDIKAVGVGLVATDFAHFEATYSVSVSDTGVVTVYNPPNIMHIMPSAVTPAGPLAIAASSSDTYIDLSNNSTNTLNLTMVVTASSRWSMSVKITGAAVYTA